MKLTIATSFALGLSLIGCKSSEPSHSKKTGAASPAPTAQAKAIPGVANPTWPNVGLQPAGAPPLDWWRQPNPCPPGTSLIKDLTIGAGDNRELHMLRLRRKGKNGYSLEDPAKDAMVTPVSAPADPLVASREPLIDAREKMPYESFEPHRKLPAYYAYCAHEDGRTAGPWSALYDDHKTWITGWYVDDQRHGRFRAWSTQGEEMGSFEMVLGKGQRDRLREAVARLRAPPVWATAAGARCEMARRRSATV